MPKRIEPLEWPIEMTCANCGAKARGYPYPFPRGSLYCQNCSPAWLEDFLVYACEESKGRGYQETKAGN